MVFNLLQDQWIPNMKTDNKDYTDRSRNLLEFQKLEMLEADLLLRRFEDL